MEKITLEFSPEQLEHIKESLLDILNSLKIINRANRELFENWDKPKKADYLGQGSRA
ncbi:MAG: hypothetical protein WC901_03390 [Candidatus Margulisiibacteriota bacterium]